MTYPSPSSLKCTSTPSQRLCGSPFFLSPSPTEDSANTPPFSHLTKPSTEILCLYRQGISILTIARAFDMKPRQIIAYFKASGVWSPQEKMEKKHTSLAMHTEEIKALHQEKSSVLTLARRYHVSYSKMYLLLRKAKAWKKEEAPSRYPFDEERQAVETLYKEGMAVKHIASQYKTSIDFLKKWLTQEGLTEKYKEQRATLTSNRRVRYSKWQTYKDEIYSLYAQGTALKLIAQKCGMSLSYLTICIKKEGLDHL